MKPNQLEIMTDIIKCLETHERMTIISFRQILINRIQEDPKINIKDAQMVVFLILQHSKEYGE